MAAVVGLLREQNHCCVVHLVVSTSHYCGPFLKHEFVLTVLGFSCIYTVPTLLQNNVHFELCSEGDHVLSPVNTFYCFAIVRIFVCPSPYTHVAQIKNLVNCVIEHNQSSVWQ